jgi:hypothetical protein
MSKRGGRVDSVCNFYAKTFYPKRGKLLLTPVPDFKDFKKGLAEALSDTCI